MKTMKELSLKMKLFPCLVNLLLGDQIRLFGITNDTTSSLGVALVLCEMLYAHHQKSCLQQ